MSSGSFKDIIYKTMIKIIYSIYMYEKDLALNNLERFILHKIKPNQTY